MFQKTKIIIAASLTLLLWGCKSKDVPREIEQPENATTIETPPLSINPVGKWYKAFEEEGITEYEELELSRTHPEEFGSLISYNFMPDGTFIQITIIGGDTVANSASDGVDKWEVQGSILHTTWNDQSLSLSTVELNEGILRTKPQSYYRLSEDLPCDINKRLYVLEWNFAPEIIPQRITESYELDSALLAKSREYGTSDTELSCHVRFMVNCKGNAGQMWRVYGRPCDFPRPLMADVQEYISKLRFTPAWVRQQDGTLSTVDVELNYKITIGDDIRFEPFDLY